jgi:hypothetical protein
MKKQGAQASPRACFCGWQPVVEVEFCKGTALQAAEKLGFEAL